MDTLQERLQEIIQTSYQLLCKKIVGGSICINSEATLQHYFGLILSDVGHLYEFGKTDIFTVSMEYEIKNIKTMKSDGVARADIFLSLSVGEQTETAAIEIKYLPKSPNEAVTDNRFYLLWDMENLEAYKEAGKAKMGFLMVYTTNVSYTRDDNSYVILGNGEKPAQSVSSDRSSNPNAAHLKGQYHIEWDSYGNDNYFLLGKI